MGYTASGNIHTGARPGMVRMADWLMARYQGGSLGIYNPASKAGGGPSLHADGRAFDLALNVNDSGERARGDAAMHYLVDHADAFGLQELLWRGHIWSYQRRAEGIRFGTQQAEHMNHVHIGIDRPTADTWTATRAPADPIPAQSPPTQEDDMGALINSPKKYGDTWFVADCIFARPLRSYDEAERLAGTNRIPNIRNAQGKLYPKPVPAAEIDPLFNAWKALT